MMLLAGLFRLLGDLLCFTGPMLLHVVIKYLPGSGKSRMIPKNNTMTEQEVSSRAIKYSFGLCHMLLVHVLVKRNYWALLQWNPHMKTTQNKSTPE